MLSDIKIYERIKELRESIKDLSVTKPMDKCEYLLYYTTLARIDELIEGLEPASRRDLYE